MLLSDYVNHFVERRHMQKSDRIQHKQRKGERKRAYGRERKKLEGEELTGKERELKR